MSADDTALEHIEAELTWAGLVLAYALRAGELALLVLIALLVSPPLLIATVVVVVPLIALGLVTSAIVALVALPVLVFRRLHGHRTPDAHATVHRMSA